MSLKEPQWTVYLNYSVKSMIFALRLPFYEQQLVQTGLQTRHRDSSLTLSEIMTILVYFHQPRYRHFKAYYCEFILPICGANFRDWSVTPALYIDYLPSALMP
jgi:hypothetical protein